MLIEISIAKEKISKMPKGSVEALKQEMTRRVSKRYEDVEVMLNQLAMMDCQSCDRPIKKMLKHLYRKLCRMPGKVRTTGLFVSFPRPVLTYEVVVVAFSSLSFIRIIVLIHRQNYNKVKLMKNNTNDGAKVYTPLTLKLYDWWVLGVSNRFAWGCPTSEYLLPHFLQHIGKKHLDIGVGTGYYLSYVPESRLISLMDLNEASLNAASTRIGEMKIQSKINHDVFETYPKALHNQFDSISMFYLLRCLPGNILTKGCVIRNAAQALTDNGTLYGASILGDGVVHNAFGQKLMHIYNRKGIFSNTEDSEEGLKQILSGHFENVKTTVKGTVVMFSASGKK